MKGATVPGRAAVFASCRLTLSPPDVVLPPAGAVADRQLRDGGRRESAAQHALQPLPAPLPGAEDRPHEPRLVRQAHPLGLPRTAHAPARHTVSCQARLVGLSTRALFMAYLSCFRAIELKRNTNQDTLLCYCSEATRSTTTTAFASSRRHH